MSITITAVPNPPSEYAIKADNNRLTMGEIRELVAKGGDIPDDFRLVNSGHGNFNLRKPR